MVRLYKSCVCVDEWVQCDVEESSGYTHEEQRNGRVKKSKTSCFKQPKKSKHWHLRDHVEAGKVCGRSVCFY